MMVSCDLCKKKIITESDPHAVIPTPKGYFDNCGCYFKTKEENSVINIGNAALAYHKASSAHQREHEPEFVTMMQVINKHNKEFNK